MNVYKEPYKQQDQKNKTKTMLLWLFAFTGESDSNDNFVCVAHKNMQNNVKTHEYH